MFSKLQNELAQRGIDIVPIRAGTRCHLLDSYACARSEVFQELDIVELVVVPVVAEKATHFQ
jgi:hypothetical protein